MVILLSIAGAVALILAGAGAMVLSFSLAHIELGTPVEATTLLGRKKFPPAPEPTEMPSFVEASVTFADRTKRTETNVNRAILIVLAGIAGIGPLQASERDVALAIHRTTVGIVVGIAALAAFLLVLVVYLFQPIRRPDRIWVASSTFASRAESLAWCYAVGGEPLAKSDQSTHDAAHDINHKVISIFDDLVRSHVTEGVLHDTALPSKIRDDSESPLITPWMMDQREDTLQNRHTTYTKQRINAHLTFYVESTRRLRRRALRWNTLVITITAGGIAASALQAIGLLPLGVVALVAAMLLGSFCWLQLRAYARRSENYALAARQFQAFSQQSATTIWTEATWAAFVQEVETALQERRAEETTYAR